MKMNCNFTLHVIMVLSLCYGLQAEDVDIEGCAAIPNPYGFDKRLAILSHLKDELGLINIESHNEDQLIKIYRKICEKKVQTKTPVEGKLIIESTPIIRVEISSAGVQKDASQKADEIQRSRAKTTTPNNPVDKSPKILDTKGSAETSRRPIPLTDLIQSDKVPQEFQIPIRRIKWWVVNTFSGVYYWKDGVSTDKRFFDRTGAISVFDVSFENKLYSVLKVQYNKTQCIISTKENAEFNINVLPNGDYKIDIKNLKSEYHFDAFSIMVKP